MMSRFGILVVVVFSFVLAGCSASTDSQIQVGGLGFNFAMTTHWINLLFIALMTLISILLIALIVNRRKGPGPAPEAFPEWLAKRDGASDADLKDLQSYSAAGNWSTNDIIRLRGVLESDANASAAEKVKRATTLGRYFNEWQNQSSAPGGTGEIVHKILRDIRDNGSTIFLSMFALAVFIALVVGLSNSSFFTSLAQVDQARGLITFLVAISAVAVIMLTAVNIFWASGVTFEARFTAAKDLVTIVTGILGTILGFYFGSFNGERSLSLAFDAPTNYTAIASGEEFEVRATSKGGTSPYRFDLLIADANGMPVGRNVDNKLSEDGLIKEKVRAPTVSAAEGNKKFSIVLLVRDTKGLQTRANTDIIVRPAPVQPGVTTPPTAPVTPPTAPRTAPPTAPGTAPPTTPGANPSTAPGTAPPTAPGTAPPTAPGTAPPTTPGAAPPPATDTTTTPPASGATKQ